MASIWNDPGKGGIIEGHIGGSVCAWNVPSPDGYKPILFNRDTNAFLAEGPVCLSLHEAKCWATRKGKGFLAKILEAGTAAAGPIAADEPAQQADERETADPVEAAPVEEADKTAGPPSVWTKEFDGTYFAFFDLEYAKGHDVSVHVGENEDGSYWGEIMVENIVLIADPYEDKWTAKHDTIIRAVLFIDDLAPKPIPILEDGAGTDQHDETGDDPEQDQWPEAA